MSSEFLVKQTLIKIIENAKFDCERENYKWFKLNFLNDDRKSFMKFFKNFCILHWI